MAGCGGRRSQIRRRTTDRERASNEQSWCSDDETAAEQYTTLTSPLVACYERLLLADRPGKTPTLAGEYPTAASPQRVSAVSDSGCRAERQAFSATATAIL